MNAYQTKVYNDLMKLVDTNEAFYFSDHEIADNTYRIFGYRLASYSDFLQPSAVECRGTTFELDANGDAIRLSALCQEKFWNRNENPLTMDLDYENPLQVMLKEDGSFISSYMYINSITPPELRLKSKGSLASDQAIDSMAFLDQAANLKFKEELFNVTQLGFTVNMEWCAPHNRIVIGYEQAKLVVLNIRSAELGTYVPKEIVGDYPEILSRWVEDFQREDMNAFVEGIVDEPDIEGYVIQLASGQHVKIKTSWYLALHHTKDSINNPRRLFECVLEETSDDLRTLFFDDKLAITLIEEMEAKVDKLYNHVVDTVERFYERNKELDRKDYAILGQKELDKMWFSLAMNKYVEREFSYKDFIKSKWKVLGFKDEKVEDEE